jgi:beta-glucosidase
MPFSGGETDAQIVKAVQDGTLNEADLDKAVCRILRIVQKREESLGNKTDCDLQANHDFAVKAESESAVLLENNGLLPLREGMKAAYIGPFAKKPRYQGGGSSHINPCKVTGAFEAALAKGRDVSYSEGFPLEDLIDEALMESAVKAAQAADVAVIFAGLPDSFESEGYDRLHMRLPSVQNELIKRVTAAQPNTVVVLHNGSPVECPWADNVASILEMYLGGEGVGEAADLLLWGEANPSGHLPESFPFKLADNPSFLNFPGQGGKVRYGEGIYAGYRYYDAKEMPVRWAFGHGLSYTDFEYSGARVSANSMDDDTTVTVSVDVANTGSREGKEVVMLFVSDETGTPGRPPKELKGFAKLSLKPGETKSAEMTVSAHDLTWYCEELPGWQAAPGRYKLLVGRSATDIRASLDICFSTKKPGPGHLKSMDINTSYGALLFRRKMAFALSDKRHPALF